MQRYASVTKMQQNVQVKVRSFFFVCFFFITSTRFACTVTALLPCFFKTAQHSHSNNTKRTNRSHPTVPEQVASNFVTLYPEHLAGFHTGDKRSRTGVLVIVNSTRLCSAHALFTYTFKRQKRKTLK